MERFDWGLRRARGLITAAGLAASLGGCGWTSRDEYLARHEGAAIQPQPGDGSRLTSRPTEDPFRAQAGKVAAHPADGLER